MLNRCIKLASKLENKKQRVFAIIVDNHNRVLATGENDYHKSHPLQAYYCELATKERHKIFLHAELQALVRLKGRKADAIYIARVNRKNEAVASQPCPICSMAIRDAGIKNVITT
jgi:deoxycytidylate deaminase